ncbi:CDP-alcohol phosphatidyltransferase family protein [Sphingosinicella terrae]|uniref:CDP-alcohol phosphatidyltransferase family protein n=1 Tax=Sphingosinicella terrae TaxID=2172047 RepID=UPI000E0E0792|nr:CDP-alcohol phosphatidyltransferase family protein [Sphingosinicella terrae]
MDESPASQRSPAGIAAAWLVHAFTATGAVIAILALMAIDRGDWRLAFLWLGVALVVDGIDGSFARWARVKERAPRIDGTVLDLVIDYLNYVFVPTALIWKAELVPAGSAWWLAALIQLASLYVFARADMKTEDHYFRGFPGLWNVVALYLFAVQPGPGAGAAIVLVFVLLSFAPIHFVHPFRVRDYGFWSPALATFWAAATGAMLWPDWPAAVERGLFLASAASAILLVLLGLVRTLRGPRGTVGTDGEHGTFLP